MYKLPSKRKPDGVIFEERRFYAQSKAICPELLTTKTQPSHANGGNGSRELGSLI
jgi:hypothetical protein